jgi:hypothetical protein
MNWIVMHIDWVLIVCGDLTMVGLFIWYMVAGAAAGAI